MDPTVAARVEMAKLCSSNGKAPLTFHHKYGFDTSGDHNMLQQGGALLGKDSHCIGSFFTFLQLTAKINGEDVVLVTNPLANSPNSCVPLRLFYRKETTGNFLLQSL